MKVRFALRLKVTILWVFFVEHVGIDTVDEWWVYVKFACEFAIKILSVVLCIRNIDEFECLRTYIREHKICVSYKNRLTCEGFAFFYY